MPIVPNGREDEHLSGKTILGLGRRSMSREDEALGREDELCVWDTARLWLAHNS
ncbi:MAG: hypothetical protein HOK20_04710 [Alphaproteobacteria bacterium]|nr:hypothetical protein [Alphaproteobacteria bacterium]MBT5540877.1 hypothetical protein [Alphaproteobacteria bacterium]